MRRSASRRRLECEVKSEGVSSMTPLNPDPRCYGGYQSPQFSGLVRQPSVVLKSAHGRLICWRKVPTHHVQSSGEMNQIGSARQIKAFGFRHGVLLNFNCCLLQGPGRMVNL